MSDEASTSSASTTPLSGTTQELFRIWQASCLRAPDPSSHKDKLRTEACSVFQSLVTGTEFVAGDVVLKTKSSHEEALAVLIRELGPAFSSDRHVSRICALSTLTGAVEGCATATLSVTTLDLLGKFMLVHCGPIQDDGSMVDEDYDEQIRDAAIVGLSLLVAGSTAALSAIDAIAVVRNRLELAKTGVERRCAAPELEDKMQYDHGYGGASSRSRVQSGLSTLPRSRRALCFGLIRSAVEGIAVAAREQPPSVESALTVVDELAEFSTFAASCLYGESDPRCLMQLLSLFGTLLKAFYPFFLAAKIGAFPVTELFDAVAPYYPIQFTPPPNDVHGISKTGLRQALLSVLGFTGYDIFAAEQEQDAMLQLTLGIVLERLVPPEEDGPSTAADKLEALQDIVDILFAPGSTNCASMDTMTVHQLSNVFLVVHDEASMAFVKGGAEAEQAKQVADLCRNVVAKIALDLELTSERMLWQTFVLEPLQTLSSRLSSSVSQSRTAIAYVACLCACGGPKTLRSSLELALVPLFGAVSSEMQDDPDIATAAYAIGAFFSSCHVALQKAEKNGVVVNPHPLAQYVGTAVDKLSKLVVAPVDGDDATSGRQTSMSVETAAVRAMESVLLVSPAEHFSPNQVQKATRFVKSIVAHVVEGSKSTNTGGSNEEAELHRVCAETLGRLLGKVMDTSGAQDDSNSDETKCILNTETVGSFLFLRFAFATLMSCAGTSRENHIDRWYDMKALAWACSSSLAGASRIVGSLVKSLHGALQQDIKGASAKAYTASLSYILRKGGSFASAAYMELASPSITPFEVLDVLVSLPKEDTTGVGSLRLPPTADDCNQILDNAYAVISQLLPAYQSRVPIEHLQKLASIILAVLPPLTEADTLKLSVYLPVVAAAIEHSDIESSPDRTVVEGNWTSIASDLADFALAATNHPGARSHAVGCMHAIISRCIPGKEKQCPSLTILQSTVLPSLQGLVGTEADIRPTDAESDARVVCKFTDGLSVAAVLGSAAACRGGTSSKTADSSTTFLIDLACSKESVGAYFGVVSHDVKLAILDNTKADESSQVSTGLTLAAASAFGTILSTEGATPLLKQRLTHIAVKQIVKKLKDTASVNEPLSQSLGTLAVVGHLVCSSSLRSITDSDMHVITGTVIGGLVSVSAMAIDAQNKSVDAVANVVAVKKIILCAILKIVCTKQTDTLSNSVYSIVMALMRAYAGTADAEPVSEVACKLLALQGLAAVTLIGGARDTLQVVQRAVVSLLGAAMNHPSSILRHAAVDARNAWFLLD